jgi:hypothetical protein
MVQKYVFFPCDQKQQQADNVNLSKQTKENQPDVGKNPPTNCNLSGNLRPIITGIFLILQRQMDSFYTVQIKSRTESRN